MHSPLAGEADNLKNSTIVFSALDYVLVLLTGSIILILRTIGGEQAGETIHRISGNLNLRAYGFTAGLSSQIPVAL